MIKANELRVGNLLEVDGNILTVQAIINDEKTPELYFKENEDYNHILNAKPIFPVLDAVPTINVNTD